MVLLFSHTHTFSHSLPFVDPPTVHTGCVAKLCNNLSLAISMIGTAEAMNLVSTAQNVL